MQGGFDHGGTVNADRSPVNRAPTHMNETGKERVLALDGSPVRIASL